MDKTLLISQEEMDFKFTQEVAATSEALDVQALPSSSKYQSSVEIIEEINKAKLKSRDGNGYLVGDIMQVFSRLETDKAVILSINHSELDRRLALENPYLLIQGLVMAAKAANTQRVYIYVSESYQLVYQMLQATMKQLKKRNYFNNLQVDVNLQFIKEENIHYYNDLALLSSYKENLDVSRYPFEEIKEVWNNENLFISNVETYLNIGLITENGGEWYKEIGEDQDNTGTKVFYIKNNKDDCLVEVPMGTTIKNLIEEASEKIEIPEYKALKIGGDLGGFITSQQLNLKINYKNFEDYGLILGAGVVEIIDDYEELENLLLESLKTNQYQSCGKCSTCREGLKRMADLVIEASEANEANNNEEKIKFFTNTIKDASLCGFGRKAANPIFAAVELSKKN